jgi:ribonucleotide reductase beta subunit family protein with ferritin-like domain
MEQKFDNHVQDEVLLRPNPERFVSFPIQHHDVWDLYKATLAQVWMAEDIDFSGDPKDWETLNDGERHFLSMVLAFFAASDGIVMENINSNFATEVQLPEVRAYYSYQSCIEQIHSETYSLMIDCLIPDPTEKLRLFHAITEVPIVRKLAQWAFKWMNADTQPFRVRIIAFVCYEGLLFSDKFCSIFWFKKRNKLPGVCHANLLIARDEGSHEDHGILLHQKLVHKCPPEVILSIVQEAVSLDVEFMTEALNVELIGMNSDMMIEYVHLVADRLLVRLGCARYYNANTNMLSDMMDTIGMENKVSFFEHRNHVYQRANVMQSVGQKNDQFTFSTDESF